MHTLKPTETYLRVMRLLEARPDITQRELSTELHVSLGKVNYCLKSMVDKGWVKIENFRQSEGKVRYAYLLTPRGVNAKTTLTALFLKRKVQEYETLGAEICELENEVRKNSALA